MTEKGKHKNSQGNNKKQGNPAGDHNQTTSGTSPKDYPLIPLTGAVKDFKETYSTTQQANETQAGKQLLVQRLLCLFTFLGFVVASIYACITYRQWKDLRRNFAIEQRPWIGIKDGIVNRNENGTVEWDAKIINTGKLPAFKVKTYQGLQFLYSDQAADLGIRGNSSSTTGVIYPGNDGSILAPLFISDNSTELRILTVQEQNALNAGDAYVVSLGSAAFEDPLGLHHWVRWCIPYIFSKQFSVNAQACTEFNSADSNWE
jgi:hypothetical protein